MPFNSKEVRRICSVTVYIDVNDVMKNIKMMKYVNSRFWPDGSEMFSLLLYWTHWQLIFYVFSCSYSARDDDRVGKLLVRQLLFYFIFFNQKVTTFLPLLRTVYIFLTTILLVLQIVADEYESTVLFGHTTYAWLRSMTRYIAHNLEIWSIIYSLTRFLSD